MYTRSVLQRHPNLSIPLLVFALLLTACGMLEVGK